MEKYLDFKNNINYDELKEVANCIKNGGIAIFPTETVYGIGTNCLNENSVNRVYELKMRPKNKSISVLVSNIQMIRRVARKYFRSRNECY